MDRQIVYAGAIPLETDLLNTNRNMMVALGGLAAAMFGTTTIVNGLTCSPTSPASMQVKVGPGEIYSLANLDDEAYSSLPIDTAHQIMKQGVALDSVTLNCPAPTTVGYSVNYLIEARFTETDTAAETLPYYNASDPTSAYSGPANSGVAQPTARAGTITITAKPGIAATAGTQTTPAADGGYVGLWVVTVAYGASSITSGNIVAVVGAPVVPPGGIVANLVAVAYATRAEGVAGTNTTKAVNCDTMAQAVQGGAYTYATATGSANALAAALAPAPAAITNGMSIRVKITATNTGAATLNLNATGAVAIQSGGVALTGGELVSGQIVTFTYDGSAWEASLSPGAVVPRGRSVATSGLATGGGDLSADRTINVPKASSSDVVTGTDDTKALTALALATGSAPVVTGQQTSTRLPGGLIIKTGTTNSGAPYSEGSISDSFAVAFPNACFVVIPVAINTAASTVKDIWAQRTSIGTTGFTMMLEWTGGSGSNSIDGIDWVAFGR